MFRWLLAWFLIPGYSRLQPQSYHQGAWTHPIERLYCNCLLFSGFGDETFIPRLPTSRGWGSSEPMVARVELVTSGTRTPSAALDTPCPRLCCPSCYKQRLQTVIFYSWENDIVMCFGIVATGTDSRTRTCILRTLLRMTYLPQVPLYGQRSSCDLSRYRHIKVVRMGLGPTHVS